METTDFSERLLSAYETMLYQPQGIESFFNHIVSVGHNSCFRRKTYIFL